MITPDINSADLHTVEVTGSNPVSPKKTGGISHAWAKVTLKSDTFAKRIRYAPENNP